jgi:hypothetical protein
VLTGPVADEPEAGAQGSGAAQISAASPINGGEPEPQGEHA